MFPKKTHQSHIAVSRRQQGNGLVGLLAGLILATLIIIAVLLVLNSNSKREFKQEPTLSSKQSGQAADASGSTHTAPAANGSDAMTTEQAADQQASGSVLSIKEPTEGSSTPATATDNADKPATPADDSAKPTTDTATNGTAATQESAAPRPTAPAPVVSNAANNRNNRNNDAPAATYNRPRPSASSGRDVKGTSVFRDNDHTPVKKAQQNNNRQATAKRPNDLPKIVENGALIEHPSTRSKTPVVKNTKPADKAKAPAQTAKNKTQNITPSPELILESGSIEKAREAARKQALAKQQNAKNAKPAAPAKTESKQAAAKTPPASSGSGKGNVVLQAGSFINAKAADAQRARLAMMGVQTKIVEAQVNGKSVYRVQTQRMNGSKAAQAKDTLQKNGVAVYQRSE